MMVSSNSPPVLPPFHPLGFAPSGKRDPLPMSVASTAVPVRAPPDISLRDLFIAFMQVSLSGFGGVLAWTYRMFVENRHWLTAEEFAETLSFCQLLPGPNIINMAISMGLRFQGTKGALAALAGVLVVPFGSVLALGVLYSEFGGITIIHRALLGIAAAAAGMMLQMGVKMALPMKKRPVMAIFGILAFVGVVLLQVPLIAVLLALAPLSIAFAWWRPR
jgi:chromate transporter